MSKYEFLDQLKDYLSGQIPDSAVRGHLDYYRSYIENEVRNGRPEADVISELGDPRLLGKTIIDTHTAKTADNSSRNSSDRNYSSGSSYSSNTNDNAGSHSSQTRNLLEKIKVILIIVLILMIVFFLIRFAVRLLLYILPVIIVLAVISYFLKRR